MMIMKETFIVVVVDYAILLCQAGRGDDEDFGYSLLNTYRTFVLTVLIVVVEPYSETHRP